MMSWLSFHISATQQLYQILLNGAICVRFVQQRGGILPSLVSNISSNKKSLSTMLKSPDFSSQIFFSRIQTDVFVCQACVSYLQFQKDKSDKSDALR